jgi:hypothetical protein
LTISIGNKFSYSSKWRIKKCRYSIF